MTYSNYLNFIMKSSFIDPYVTHTDFNVAPKILPANERKVKSIFHLGNKEGILIVRNFLTMDNAEKFLVITDCGVYQNFLDYNNAIPWKDLSSVHTAGGEVCFFRNFNILFRINKTYIIRDENDESIEQFCSLLSRLCTYSPRQISNSVRAFQKHFEQYAGYCNDKNAVMPWFDEDSYNRLLESCISGAVFYDLNVAENEPILLYRNSGLFDTCQFCLTDRRLYVRYLTDKQDEPVQKDFLLRKLERVTVVEDKKLMFIMKTGEFFCLEVNNIIKKRFGFISPGEVADLAVRLSNSLNEFISFKSVIQFFLPKKGNKYQLCKESEYLQEKHRCCNCGSTDIFLYEDERDRKKRERAEKALLVAQIGFEFVKKLNNPGAHVSPPNEVNLTPKTMVKCRDCNMMFIPLWMSELPFD